MNFGYYIKVIAGNPMSVYTLAQKTRYRVTLNIEALDDFDPHNINWNKLFDLQGDESCEVYVENLSEDVW